MSADLLRRAAEKLRQHASADYVFVAPWSAVPDDGTANSLAWSVRDPEGTVAESLGPEARYIALMHPPVALALAEWLSFASIEADHAERATANYFRAVKVARAILREEEPT